MSAGMTESQAIGKAVGDIVAQVGLAAAGGLISGGVIGAGGSAVSNLNTSQYGKQIIDAGVNETLIDRALQMPQYTDKYKLASDIQAGNVDASAKNIGRLAVSYGEAGGDIAFIDDAISRKQSEEETSGTVQPEQATFPTVQRTAPATAPRAQAEGGQITPPVTKAAQTGAQGPQAVLRQGRRL